MGTPQVDEQSVVTQAFPPSRPPFFLFFSNSTSDIDDDPDHM